MTRINISISDDLLKEVDSYRFIIKENRSAFMAKALKNYFVVIDKDTLNKKRKRAIRELKMVREEIGDKLKNWDPVSDIRKLRNSRYGK